MEEVLWASPLYKILENSFEKVIWLLSTSTWSTLINHAGQTVVFLMLGHVWGTCRKWFWPKTFGDDICLESLVFYSSLLLIRRTFYTKTIIFAKMELSVTKFFGLKLLLVCSQTCPYIRNTTICPAWFIGVDQALGTCAHGHHYHNTSWMFR